MRVNWDPNMQMAEKAENLFRQKSTSQKALKEAAEQFESLFLNQLLSEMRKTVDESSLLGDRKAEKLFQSLLDEEMANTMAKGEGVGLSRLLYEQLEKHVPDND